MRRRGLTRACRSLLPALSVGTLLVLLSLGPTLPSSGVDSGSPRLTEAGASSPTILAHTTFAIDRATAATSPNFASGPGDAIFVWFSIYDVDTVRSVTDSVGDTFTQIVNSTMAYGTSGAHNALSIWAAYSVKGGVAINVSANLHAKSTTSSNNTAVVVTDVTGVGAAPVDRLGVPNNSTGLAGQQSSYYFSQIQANPSDLILSGVAARNYDNFAAVGGDSNVDQRVSVLPGTTKAMTMAVFQEVQGAPGGSAWMNATDNKSSAWGADSLSLKLPAPPPPQRYPLTFREVGLSPGSVWAVTVNGTLNSSTANSVGFSELNGSFSFLLGSTPGYTPNLSVGSVTVAGGAVIVPIGFSATGPFYPVTFAETGLPVGTDWSVTLDRNVGRGTNSTLGFSVPNGSHTFAVGEVAGFASSPNSGTLSVAGGSVATPITFAALPTYSLAFTENGLANGTVWSVDVGGVLATATAPLAVELSESNGTYPFTVGVEPGFGGFPGSGNVTVPGRNVSIPVAFASTSPFVQHVVMIVLENAEVSAVLKSAPYMRYLSNTYGNATQFYGVCHNSLPEYVAMTSGRAYGCNGVSIQRTASVADLLETKGLTWAGYFEGMPTACDRTSQSSYSTDHNPFLHYKDIVSNSSRCSTHLLNSGAFNRSVANGSLPNFSYYIPNVENDCHSAAVAFCDAWLKSFLTPMVNSSSPQVEALMAHTAFVIVFDEGKTNLGYSVGGVVNSWCQNVTGNPLTACGGHTYLTVVSPYSVGLHATGAATDYNLESTVEWLFGLSSDGGYDGTVGFPSLSGLFDFSVNGMG
jgi:Phosphoesterase family